MMQDISFVPKVQLGALKFKIFTSTVFIGGGLSLYNSTGGYVPFSVLQTQASTAPNGFVTLTFVIPDDGYYSPFLDCTCTTASNGVFQLTAHSISGDGYVCRHLPLPDLDVNIGAAQGIKTAAFSIRYENTANPLDRQGRIVGLQVPQETHWMNYLQANSGGYEELSRSNGAGNFELKTGIYGFNRAASMSDFDFSDFMHYEEGVLVDSSWPIEGWTQYDMVYAVCNNPTGQDGRWHIQYADQYQTTDTWREKDTPRFSAKVVERACEIQSMIPQWYENPVHIAAITSALFKAAKTGLHLVANHGDKVVDLAKKLKVLFP